MNTDLKEAYILGSSVTSWAGKFKALIDGPAEAVANGWLFHVELTEHEILLYYETNKYKFVRCDMHMKDNMEGAVQGLPFRFVH